MTGMPASFAFWIAGRMALLSWARTIRTLAPCWMRVSMSVNCWTFLRFASLSMKVPPPASTVFFIAGLSAAAQRGCWKLFQDTPTTQLPAACDPAADAAAEAAADAGAADAAADAAVDGLDPLLEQAARTIATTARTGPNRRCIWSPPPIPG